jgi:Flp pilus assembly protein TadD
MYLPMIGFAACAGLLLERLRPIFVVSVLIFLIGFSFARTATWRTEKSLWTDAVAKAPAKIRPKIQLARAVEPAAALGILEQARQMAPDDPRIPSEEGRIYLGLGRPERALPEFGRALALSPHSADALNNRGVALLALDQKEAARADFERALAIDPCQFDARLNLSRLGISKPAPAECRYNVAEAAALTGN